MIEEFVHKHDVTVDERRLRELVGHTWSEVMGGILIGVLVYFVYQRL